VQLDYQHYWKILSSIFFFSANLLYYSQTLAN
jgi:hypothetical protein